MNSARSNNQSFKELPLPVLQKERIFILKMSFGLLDAEDKKLVCETYAERMLIDKLNMELKPLDDAPFRNQKIAGFDLYCPEQTRHWQFLLGLVFDYLDERNKQRVAAIYLRMELSIAEKRKTTITNASAPEQKRTRLIINLAAERSEQQQIAPVPAPAPQVQQPAHHAPNYAPVLPADGTQMASVQIKMEIVSVPVAVECSTEHQDEQTRNEANEDLLQRSPIRGASPQAHVMDEETPNEVRDAPVGMANQQGDRMDEETPNADVDEVRQPPTREASPQADQTVDQPLNADCDDEKTTNIDSEVLPQACLTIDPNHLRLSNACGRLSFANSVIQCLKAFGTYSWLSKRNRTYDTTITLTNLLKPPFSSVRCLDDLMAKMQDGAWYLTATTQDAALFHEEVMREMVTDVHIKFSVEGKATICCDNCDAHWKPQRHEALEKEVLRTTDFCASVKKIKMKDLIPTESTFKEPNVQCPSCKQNNGGVYRCVEYCVPRPCEVMAIQVPLFIDGKKVKRRITNVGTVEFKGLPWTLGACVEHLGNSLDAGRCRSWVKEEDEWSVYEDETVFRRKVLPRGLTNMYLLYFVRQ